VLVKHNIDMTLLSN